jgi:hypothetical protein
MLIVHQIAPEFQNSVGSTSPPTGTSLQRILASDFLAQRIFNFKPDVDMVDINTINFLALHALESGGSELVKVSPGECRLAMAIARCRSSEVSRQRWPPPASRPSVHPAPAPNTWSHPSSIFLPSRAGAVRAPDASQTSDKRFVASSTPFVVDSRVRDALDCRQ